MPHLTFAKLTFLVGTALGAAVLLILLAYLLMKTRRSLAEDKESMQRAPRAQDEIAFTIAAFQGVIKDLKEQQRKLEDLKQISDARADAEARRIEVITREMSQGLLRINPEGIIVSANPAACSLLGIATFSHRPHYTQVLGKDTEFCGSIQSCLKTGIETHRQEITHVLPDGNPRPLSASVVPLARRDGSIAEVVCFLSGSSPSGH